MIDFALALDPVDLGLGVVLALVAVQVYPPSANVGRWIVEKVKELIK